MRTVISLAILLSATAATAAEPVEPAAPVKLKTSDTFPTVGKATTIESPPDADTISITYSPSSRVETKTEVTIERVIPPKPGKPYLSAWVPRRAGVASLSAGGQTKNVSIRFDGIPIGGIVIMLLAGLILFGGVAVSMKSLLSGDG